MQDAKWSKVEGPWRDGSRIAFVPGCAQRTQTVLFAFLLPVTLKCDDLQTNMLNDPKRLLKTSVVEPQTNPEILRINPSLKQQGLRAAMSTNESCIAARTTGTFPGEA